jgi:hypothetical protein
MKRKPEPIQITHIVMNSHPPPRPSPSTLNPKFGIRKDKTVRTKQITGGIAIARNLLNFEALGFGEDHRF